MTSTTSHRRALQRATGQALGFKLAFDARRNVRTFGTQEARRRAASLAVEQALEAAVVANLFSPSCTEAFLDGLVSVRDRLTRG